MKGKIPHTRFIFHLVKVSIDAEVSFVQVSLFHLWRKIQYTFIHKLVLQSIIPRRYFRRQESRTHCCSLANYQDSGILQLRYAVNTLASVTPRLITKCIWLQSLGSFLTRFRSVEFGTIVYISRRQDTIFISYRTLIEEKSKRHGGVHFGVVVVD